ncbi:MAG TPA: flagellar biosynthesis protein FlaG [Janthinobacterium sp.]|nr:flagellar biosynthesis protein FlaG [Janthinobacterium sp.]
MSIDSLGSTVAAKAPERGAGDINVAATPGPAPASPVDTSTAVKPAVPVPTLAQVKQAVSDLNKSSQANARNIEFSVDKDSQRTVIKVVDQKTGEVLRQMPTHEALEIAKSLDDTAKGLLIKQTA